jgi:hypothetical protein
VDNIGGPSRATVQRTRAKKHRLLPGVCEENVLFVVNMMRDLMETRGIPLGVGLFQVSRDDTVIIPKLQVSISGRELYGACGAKGPGHVCDSHFVIHLPEDPYEAFQVIAEAIREHVAAHCKLGSVLAAHWCVL